MTNKISAPAKTVHVLPHLQSASLASLGQLCDDNCKVLLDKHSLTATKNGNIVLRGTRNPHDGLWDVSLNTIKTKHSPKSSANKAPTAPSIQKANVIIRTNQTTKELANYLHAACGSSAISTFLKAIKDGFLLSWPGIDLIKESDITPSLTTAKGHLDQEQKNLQSTQQQPTMLPTPASDATLSQPPEPPTAPDPPIGPGQKIQECFSLIQPFDKKAYSNLAGRYPHISSRGNHYIMVVYNYDSSGILVAALKNRTAGEITKAWTQIHTHLERHSNAPKLYILDNEVSYEFKSALQKQKLEFQLVPPNVH